MKQSSDVCHAELESILSAPESSKSQNILFLIKPSLVPSTEYVNALLTHVFARKKGLVQIKPGPWNFD